MAYLFLVRPFRVRHLAILVSILVVLATPASAQDEQTPHASLEAAIRSLEREGIMSGKRLLIHLTPEQQAAQTMFAPTPQYPFEARRQHVTGSGYFLIAVKISTGSVIRMFIEQSTGSKLLDAAAVTALKKWRFKPEALRASQRKYDPTDRSSGILVRVPITFMLQR